MKSTRLCLFPILILLGLLATFTLGGCGGHEAAEDSSLPPGVTPIVLRISWPQANRQISGARWVRVLVQDPHQNNLIPPETVLLRGDSSTTVNLEVPNGRQRVFTAQALDRDNVLLAQGSRVIDVGPGLPNRVTLDLGPVPDQLVVTPNPLELFVDSGPTAINVASTVGGNPVAPGSLGFTSSDLGVATVEAAGVVSPGAVGTATVTAISGTVTGTTTVNIYDFSLALSPDPVALAPGANREVTVTVTRQGGNFPLTIDSINNLPAGVQANTPVALPAGATTANVTLTAAPGAATGPVQIQAQGTATVGGRTATRTSPAVTLNVRDFTLSVQPDPARLPVGGQVDLTVTLLRQRSRQGPDFDVTLTEITGLPPGVRLSPTTSLPMVIPAGQTTALLTLEADPNTVPGIAQITIVGEISINGSTVQRPSAAATLEVFNFRLTLSPDPIFLGRENTAEVTVNLTRQRSRSRQGSDFDVTVTAVNGLPAEVTPINLPLVIPAGQPEGTIQLQATYLAAIGASTITVTGQADGAQRTSPNATLNLFDFALAWDRPEYLLFLPRAGETVDYNLPVDLNREGFNSQVDLTALNNLPGGVAATNLPQPIPPQSTRGNVILQISDQAAVGLTSVAVEGTTVPDGVNAALRRSPNMNLELIDYTLAVAPDPLVASPGVVGVLSLDLTRHGWAGDLQVLELRNLPGGTNVIPAVPTSIAAGQTSLDFTFRVANTPPGDYPMEVVVEAEVTPGYPATRAYPFTLRVQ